jgi:hypothetical protein
MKRVVATSLTYSGLARYCKYVNEVDKTSRYDNDSIIAQASDGLIFHVEEILSSSRFLRI